ncbi:MAG: hypothetical protein ABIE94_04335 [archaeon]
MAKKPLFDTQGYLLSLDRVSMRLLVLEKEYQKENSFIRSRDERLETVKEGFDRNVNKIKRELEEMKEGLRALSRQILIVGKGLKDVAKKDEVSRIEERIDDWPLERFAKKDEI